MGEEIDLGLEAWQRLVEVRGPSCPRSHVLRDTAPSELAQNFTRFANVYLDVMEQAGCRSGPVRERLAALSASQLEQQDRQTEAWNRACMAREEARQTKQFVRARHRIHDQAQGADDSSCASVAIDRLQYLLCRWDLLAERRMQ